MTNIIPFPGNAHGASRAATLLASGERPYEFTPIELSALCRWYSAMKFAFPAIEGVMTVCHRRRMSAVGLYGRIGAAPSCLLSKHERNGRPYLMWAAEPDVPCEIGSVEELIRRQIGAIAPPRNERRWLDIPGWEAIVALGLADAGLTPA
jgi:hypothetical protein